MSEDEEGRYDYGEEDEDDEEQEEDEETYHSMEEVLEGGQTSITKLVDLSGHDLGHGRHVPLSKSTG